jgi:acyl-coenzyme A thioesterase PaaI-like protein
MIVLNENIALQDKYGPQGICFGCGPKNEKGLQIKTFIENNDTYIVHFQPKKEHQAFEGVINGGIIGAVFDCHCNWASANEIFKKNPEKEFPSTVTAEFKVKLKRPTPFGVKLLFKAKIVNIDGVKATVEAELLANDKVTATCTGVFVSVEPGHPGYHRWN